MTHILLIRHGHVAGIAPERFRGRMELELTDQGVSQARMTGQYIARQWHPTAVYTSPMGRCVATGREIAAACDAPTHELWEINDLDYGDWQWKTHEEVRQSWPDEYRLWRRSPQLVRFPNGESLPELAARTAEGLRIMLRHHSDDSIVLVGHDASNRALLLQALDMPLSAFWILTQDPCGLSEFLIDENRKTVVRINETAHLSPAPGATMP